MLQDDPTGDARLHVRFYKGEQEHSYNTETQGRPVRYMADMVRIEVPGNALTIIDTLATDYHRQRFPVQWSRFKNEEAQQIEGTMLHDWPLLTAAQATELRHFKFHTVEQVAGASDQQISSVQMIVGMSPFSFRDKARAFLALAANSSLATQQADELKKRDLQIAELQEQVRQLADKPKKKEAATA